MERVVGHGPAHKKEVDPKKKTFLFIVGTYIEDVKQGEEHVSDLLDAVKSPTFFVKKELPPILFKMNQFRTKITKNEVDPKVRSPKIGLQMDPRQFLKRPTLFGDIWPRKGPNLKKRCRF